MIAFDTVTHGGAGALVDLGEALRVAGRRGEARDPLPRGIDLAAECGSIALRTRAVAALEALGDRPRKLMFAGAGVQALFVPPKTGREPPRPVLHTLGINGRRELARVLS